MARHMETQLTLFDEPTAKMSEVQTARAGTFIDNMALPVHRWFRYSAGFAAQWVEQVLDGWGVTPAQVVLDPFAGSATVPVSCDTRGIRSIGVEAHPVVARIRTRQTGLDHTNRPADPFRRRGPAPGRRTTQHRLTDIRSSSGAALTTKHCRCLTG